MYTPDVTLLGSHEATITHLRALIAELHSAREEERTRTARAIHDELGSALTCLRWGLEELEKAIIEPETTTSLQSLQDSLNDLFRLSNTAIETVRRLASELRPCLLDDLGLAAAIEWQAQQFQTKTGIRCHCEQPQKEVHLTRDQSTAVFRIFQDALSNVKCLPQAGIVSVFIEENTREFKLRISDNGGTNNEKSGQLPVGVLGMRERARLVNGTVDIDRSSPTGTAIVVRIPISQRRIGVRDGR